jgi:hypothetical protein
MRQFHITYYIKMDEAPLLGGLTIEAADIVKAVQLAVKKYGIDINRIKYVVEL